MVVYQVMLIYNTFDGTFGSMSWAHLPSPLGNPKTHSNAFAG